jgi:hypothetical protein
LRGCGLIQSSPIKTNQLEITLIKQRLIEQFSKELDFSIILRKSTLVDLIILDFSHFQNEPNSRYLISILYNAIKITFLSALKEIKLDSDNYKDYKKTELEIAKVLGLLDELFEEVQSKLFRFKSKTIYELNDKIQHLRIVNQSLEIDEYSNEIYSEIIYNIMNILVDETK